MSLHRVLGTAGHIDHGKTSLVKALTGIDTDRLKEEQERGITIELGFAHLQLPTGDVVGVVDVPGHERFIRTMVAGAVGIDAVVLVVAADEGVMPQTREHLDICELLGVRTGVVALSKSDLCEPELRELATLELRETLRGTFLAQAPIVPCSARTGEGLPELVAAIAKVLATAPGRDERGLLRLPVDRVFSLRGFGTVATGTLWSGRLQLGDELVPLPGPKSDKLPPAKVRGLHVHGVAVDAAVAGQRTAVNLTLPLSALSRGETLVRPGTLQAGVLLEVRLQLLGVARAPLGRRSRLLLHAGTTQRLAQVTLLDRGELQPGGWAWAQLQVDAPLAAQPGDRFVLRGFAPQKNHGTTVGGGVVLRVLGSRHRHGTPELCARLSLILQALLSLHGDGPLPAVRTLLRLELRRRGLTGASRAALRIAVPVAEEALLAALRAELREGTVRELGTAATGEQAPLAAAGGAAGGGDEVTYVSRAAFDFVCAEILRTVAAYHQSAPRSEGLPREALRLQLGRLGAAKASARAGSATSPPASELAGPLVASPGARASGVIAGKPGNAIGGKVGGKAEGKVGGKAEGSVGAKAGGKVGGKVESRVDAMTDGSGRGKLAAGPAGKAAGLPAAPPSGRAAADKSDERAVGRTDSLAEPADTPDPGEGPKILCPPRLLHAAVEALVRAGRLLSERELLRLPSHRVVSDAAERALAERVAEVYLRAALGPPRLEELAALLGPGGGERSGPGATAADLKQATEALVRAGTLVRIKDLLFHRQAVDELRVRLIAFLKEHRELNPTQWKDLVGQSRKFTIPLAEHFDGEKLTLRVGDLRRLRILPTPSS